MTASENGTVASKVWLDILKEMLANPSAPVSCPRCKAFSLTVVDVPRENDSRFDRDLICKKCGAHVAFIGVSPPNG